MPVDYSQNGKAQNARHLAREDAREAEDARVERLTRQRAYLRTLAANPSEDYGVNGDYWS